MKRHGYAVSLFVRTDFIYVYEQRMIYDVDFHVIIDYEKCGFAAALFPGLRGSNTAVGFFLCLL
jgi:hypothetical protein